VHIETTTFERAVHLLLFVVGGLAFAVGGLAVLEGATGAERQTIRLPHVIGTAAAFVALAGIELLFHVLR
jgi:hypothetical protein